jgi:hypothetical protein
MDRLAKISHADDRAIDSAIRKISMLSERHADRQCRTIHVCLSLFHPGGSPISQSGWPI